jgi:hypothetical protein
VPQLVPLVERVHPAVSVSVLLAELQAPPPQVNVVTVRVRLPDVEQVSA